MFLDHLFWVVRHLNTFVRVQLKDHANSQCSSRVLFLLIAHAARSWDKGDLVFGSPVVLTQQWHQCPAPTSDKLEHIVPSCSSCLQQDSLQPEGLGTREMGPQCAANSLKGPVPYTSWDESRLLLHEGWGWGSCALILTPLGWRWNSVGHTWGKTWK